MNQIQVRYIRERAKTIYDKKKYEIRDRHTIKSIELSTKDMVQALERGDWDTKKDVRSNAYHIRDFIVFTNETKGKVNQKAIDKDTEKLNTRYNNLLDEILLGDAKQLLTLLKEFEDA